MKLPFVLHRTIEQEEQESILHLSKLDSLANLRTGLSIKNADLPRKVTRNRAFMKS